MTLNRLVITVVLFAFYCSQVSAQEKATAVCPSLFDGDDVLPISLHFDITTHLRKKSEDYKPGKIVFYFDDEDSIMVDVRCRARGNYRKEKCFFAPLILNFKPDTLFTTDGPLTKVKMVTHCVNSRQYTEYVLEEYLIYKLWELISPYAFRTKLLDINYVDTGKKGKNLQAKGFLIEPMYMMAYRTNTIEVDGEYFKDHEINTMDADRMAFFCYMIGNTDWRIKSGHNVKFIKRFGHRREEVTSIPYDFDHAGLVNTSYAMPAEWASVGSVTERQYIGRCRSNDDNYHTLIDEYLAVEESIYETILNFEELDLKQRKQIYKYITSFYKELHRPKSFIRMLHQECMESY
ncbi:hypothetical protein [Carboxylicivirga sp. M1479]|uniref:hypothetical protein n=1 Tax=Carboxylicivirga sp. M1479 TaxID=2594476 RepID=UPI001177F40A|nr:hypothetical protein [Carboxylicivirga sp. M1479]TRX72283.1 hypothetical protein FNN09_02605 [Carboxylicivirga sp. M1479]